MPIENPFPESTAAGRLLLVANPNSGRGRGERWLRRAERQLRREGQAVECVLTRRRGEAEELARGSLEPFAAVWAIGGDGTINELAQGLRGAPIPLCVLPAGTANIVAREFAIPRRFAPAFRCARRGRSRSVDLGEASGRTFTFMVSAGFDATVVLEVHRRRRGSLRMWDYVPAVWAARRQEEPRFAVAADGEPIGGVCWAAVFNVSRYGSGVRACPRARPDDGRLDLLTLRDPVGPRARRVLTAAARGRLESLPDAEHRVVRSVLMEDVPCAQMDGDPFPVRRLEVRVQPAALRLRCPPAVRTPAVAPPSDRLRDG